MIHTYVATFVSGLQEPVSHILVRRLSDVKIKMLLDGLIVFSTALDPRDLVYFNNVFLLLHPFQECGTRPLHKMLDYITRSRPAVRSIAKHQPARSTSFRIVTSRENKLVPVDNKMLTRAEQHLASAAGMRVNRNRPEIEFWCLYRKEGVGFFMMRLTKHATTAKILHKGELRPQLASLLCELSEPHASDVFMDPCCGYGSIPLARVRLAPCRTIYAFDSDVTMIRHVRARSRRLKKKPSARSWHVERGNARHLDTLKDGTIDKIVTDPPWGIFDDEMMDDIHHFYHDLVSECTRLLTPSGIFVVLTARNGPLIPCLQQNRGILPIVDTYDILVSGKKATVYKILKVKR